MASAKLIISVLAVALAIGAYGKDGKEPLIDTKVEVVNEATLWVDCEDKSACKVKNKPAPNRDFIPACFLRAGSNSKTCQCGDQDEGYFFDGRDSQNYMCYKKTTESCNSDSDCDPQSECDSNKCQCKNGCTDREGHMGCTGSCQKRDPEPYIPPLPDSMVVKCEETDDCKVTNKPAGTKQVCESGECSCASGNTDYFFDNRGGPGKYECFKKTNEECNAESDCDEFSDCLQVCDKEGALGCPKKCQCKKGCTERTAGFGCEGECNNGSNMKKTSVMLVIALYIMSRIITQ